MCCDMKKSEIKKILKSRYSWCLSTEKTSSATIGEGDNKQKTKVCSLKCFLKEVKKRLCLLVNCPKCNKNFKKKGNAKYCSPNCGQAVLYQKLKNLRKEQGKFLKCKTCRKSFRKIKNTLTCSEKCSLK